MRKYGGNGLKNDRLLNPDVAFINGLETDELITLFRQYFLQNESGQRIIEKMTCAEDFREVYRKYIFLRQFEEFLDGVYGKVDEMYYPCTCEICGRIQKMIVTRAHPGDERINWRETIVCPACKGSNHIRHLIGKIKSECEQNQKIAIFERGQCLRRYAEELPVGLLSCDMNCKDEFEGMKARLNDELGMCDLVLANDVLEYMKDYRELLQISYDLLASGGKLVFCTVFNANNNKTEGCVFGWDILKELEDLGYSESYAVADFSVPEGYLGYLPVYFEAVK